MVPPRETQLLTFDFTKFAGEEESLPDSSDIIDWLKLNCRSWAFQEEETSAGLRHYQGRFQLKERMRLGQLIHKWKDSILGGAHFSGTSNANKGNNFYVMKEASRVNGPWSDKIEQVYIPSRVRNADLKSWQLSVVGFGAEPEDREIHLIFDPEGNTGKSFLVAWMCSRQLAYLIPPLDNHKDIMQTVLQRIGKCYLFDLPRALDKRKLTNMWAAIEEIKNGHAYDTRYSYREQWFEPPAIVVFSNVLPDPAVLSRDRWRIWYIKDDRLVANPQGFFIDESSEEPYTAVPSPVY